MTPSERSEFIADIAAAMRPRASDVQISAEQLQWVNLAIQKEAQSIKLRQAIIEKTLGKAGWFLLIAESGYWNFSYIKDLGNGSCVRGTWGWNFIPVAKGYTSVNTGILETDLVRMYSFVVTGK